MRLPDLAISSGRIELQNFVTPPGLVLASLVIDTGGVRSLGGDVCMDEPGRFRATIDDTELSRFIGTQKTGGLKEIRVTAADGLLGFAAVKTVLIDVRIRASIRPVIIDEARIELRLETAQAMGVGVGNLVESQVEKANPILDSDDLPLPVRFLGIVVDSGVMILEGTFSAPAR